MFGVGETVVYPSYGIGEVEDLVDKNTAESSTQITYYIIKIQSTGAKVMIPVEKAMKLGIREISDSKKITKAFKVIRQEASVAPNVHWNRRYKEYMVKIKTGCLLDMAEVYRDLNALQVWKSLSFGEKKILENVGNLLALEIAESKGIQLLEARNLLKKAVAV